MTVRLVDLRETPLSVDEVVSAVNDRRAGGTTTFSGAVRDHDDGRDVDWLSYTAHPSALAQLQAVAETVAARHDVIAVAAVHRTGHLEVGDLAVVVAASAVHRDEAFAAARDLIDTLKAEVPIWKEQGISGGAPEWVGAP